MYTSSIKYNYILFIIDGKITLQKQKNMYKSNKT